MPPSAHTVTPVAPHLSPRDARVQRLRLAFDLFDAGVAMERLRLHRLHPDLDDDAIETRLQAWLRREGEPGDADGTVVAWPREPRAPR